MSEADEKRIIEAAKKFEEYRSNVGGWHRHLIADYIATRKAECEYWQSKLKERDELLEEMANKSQESIEMMKFAERHGDVVGFRIWQKLHEVITDLLTRYSNLKAK